MADDLATRFFSDWPGAFTPGAEIVYEIPRRQQQLLAQGQMQLEALRGIHESNAIIAAEVTQQAATLERNLREFGDQISSCVMEASQQLQQTIELLGDRLCGYLGDIRWELAQQSEILAGILDVLQKSRSNEARQLVEQGLRHYASGQFDRAEERFLEALKQDTTDYQVLLNLGLVEVQKGNQARAFEYFTDALRLPGKLDSESKVRASMCLARVSYVQREYKRAHSIAQQAIRSYGFVEVSNLYLEFKYGALAGELPGALGTLEKAIALDPMFFSRARVDPDLGGNSQTAVFELLSRLARKAHELASHAVATNNELLHRIPKHEDAIRFSDLIERAGELAKSVEQQVAQASYSDLLRLERNASRITDTLQTICSLEDTLHQAEQLQEKFAAADATKVEAQEHLSALPNRRTVRLPLWFLWHLGSFVTMFVLGLALSSQMSREAGGEIGLLVSLYFVFGWVGWLLLSKAIDAWNRRAQKAFDMEYGNRQSALCKVKSVACQVKGELDRKISEIAALRKKIQDKLNQSASSMEAAGFPRASERPSAHMFPYSMIGKKIDSAVVQGWLSKVGSSPKIVKICDRYDYWFKPAGISLVFDKNNTVTAISLHCGGRDGFQQYQGELPFGLSFQLTRKDVESTLGQPDTSEGGGISSCHTFYPSKGLEIYYDTIRVDDLSARISLLMVT